MAYRENTMFIVKNRSTSQVLYSIPSLGIRRSFAPGESMKISYGELVKFMYEPGAKKLMANFLQIQEAPLLNEFNMPVQPEYYMNESQIRDLLLNGSLDAFLDCLDFAPAGVIDLVKEYAIALPLSDYQKRQALREKLDFDVDHILEMKRAEQKEQEEAKAAKEAAPVITTTRPRPVAPTGRRTAGPVVQK